MSVTSTSSYGPVTVSGTVTEYLPLTTAWPFSAGCSTQILSNGFSSISAPSSIYFNDPKYANVVPGQPTCLPPEVSYWWYQDKKASTTTLLGGYSFLCPEAYSTAYSTVGTTSNSVTTTIGCCPTAYEFYSLHSAVTPQQCGLRASGKKLNFSDSPKIDCA